MRVLLAPLGESVCCGKASFVVFLQQFDIRTRCRTRGYGRTATIRYPPRVPMIVLNGDEHRSPADATVATLLDSLDLNPQQVAVERNREIVPRAAYSNVRLLAGDKLEVVTFVGGG